MCKKIGILIACAFSVVFNTTAQDTTIIQTLEFSDITKRRGWFAFPPDTGSYRQILMYYTLKCDPATTQDSYNCGEWDYTTYTNALLHENVGARTYTVSATRPDTVFYTPQPAWNYHQSYDYFIVYDDTLAENSYDINLGSLPISDVFRTSLPSGKSQFLFTAAELTSAGLTAGNIDQIQMDLSNLGSTLNNLTIRMKHSSLNELTDSSYETSGFVETLNGNFLYSNPGNKSFQFTSPFAWDGVSNVVIEFSFSNVNTGTDYQVTGGNAGFNAGIVSSETEQYLDFQANDYIELPTSMFSNLDSFVTVSFWHYGDPAVQPSNTTIFEGLDSNNRRVLNVHAPWSNGRIYWDAGNSGTASYDRIDKAAVAANYEGQWNHWAFVKDVAAGQMRMYLNGTLWHSGSGNTRTMEDIASFRISKSSPNGGNSYDGYLDEFRIWNKALTQTEIEDWMHKKVNPSHTSYANLMAAYDFSVNNSTIVSDYSGNGNHGNMIGLPQINLLPGTEIDKNLQTLQTRPNITFIQGSYLSHLDSVMVIDSVLLDMVSILVDSTSRNLQESSIVFSGLDSLYGYIGNTWTYTYDPNGVVVDSQFVSSTDTLINEYQLNTHQLQNYVTPYGIGLDLGPDGFRWVYDVTDYEPILHDTIEIRAGNQQELIDLKFLFISGTPPRDVVDFETIWLGDYQHADIANDVVMPAIDMDLNPIATQHTVRTRTTGHWFGGFENCAEFCPKYHNLSINGTQEFEWLNWKECSNNPVVDQGGTWIYDRAGWCPGTFADTYDHDITPFVTQGGTASIDYGMEYTAGGMEGNYRTTVQLISYGDNNFSVDASIVDVIAPNKWEFHNRFNPICGTPVIVIKNTGSDTLKSVKITYRVEGGADVVYDWTGNLAFGEQETVALYTVGAWFWSSGSGTQKFVVELSEPNGGVDQNSDNNVYYTDYDLPPTLPEHWYLWFRSNNAGSENSYYLYNSFGDTLYQRVGWANITTYRDTFDLEAGCYTLEILDSDEDGVSFFANGDGNGWIRWRPVTGGAIHTFEPNFGDKIIFNFMVGGILDYEEINKAHLGIYPNPSNGLFRIESEGFIGDVNLTVISADGRTVYSEKFFDVNGSVIDNLNLSDLPAGIYLIRMDDGTRSNTERIIIK